MKTKICSECGEANPLSSLYCKECRASLSMASIVEDSTDTIRTKLKIQAGPHRLTATYRWFSTDRLIIYLPGAFIGLLAGYCLWVFLDESLRSVSDFLLTIVSLAIFVYGIWNVYRMIKIGMNTTSLYFSGTELTVTHQPISAPGNHTIQGCDITELFIGNRKEHAWFFFAAEGSSGVLFDLSCKIYQLFAKHQDGNSLLLPEGPDYEVIHRLQQGMEKIIANRI